MRELVTKDKAHHHMMEEPPPGTYPDLVFRMLSVSTFGKSSNALLQWSNKLSRSNDYDIGFDLRIVWTRLYKFRGSLDPFELLHHPPVRATPRTGSLGPVGSLSLYFSPLLATCPAGPAVRMLRAVSLA